MHALNLIAAVAVLVLSAWPRFRSESGLVGHDYGYFFPWLTIGHNWILQHGLLAPPEFTAAFCGGAPFLANPQSVFYSLPQLLVLAMPLDVSVFLTLAIFAVLGAVGMYRLCRDGFETSIEAAVLVAVLFLLIGFLFYRLVIGHLTYHAFGLVPVLAWIVARAQVIPRSSRAAERGRSTPRLDRTTMAACAETISRRAICSVICRRSNGSRWIIRCAPFAR